MNHYQSMLTISIVLLSSLSYAFNPISSSPLLPGTKVIASNHDNEFFIVTNQTNPKSVNDQIKHEQRNANKIIKNRLNGVTNIKLAANTLASYKTAQRIKSVLVNDLKPKKIQSGPYQEFYIIHPTTQYASKEKKIGSFRMSNKLKSVKKLQQVAMLKQTQFVPAGSRFNIMRYEIE